MHIQTRIYTWTLGTLIAVAIGGSILTPHDSEARETDTRETEARHTVIPASPRVAFAWPGVYDLVGSGFPDGERRAVMHIARTDTSYALVSVQGPPGALVRFRVSGDSAHIVWDLGGESMVVDLRGSGDSLTGEWQSGDWSGPLRGARRP